MGDQISLNHSRINMKLFTATLLCLVVPVLGAPKPQGYYRLGPQHSYSQRSYGGQVYRRTSNPYQTVRSTASRPLSYYNYPVAPVKTASTPKSVQTPFGVFKLAARNSMTRQSRNQYLPVMRALLKVMETSTPAPEDVNTLLVLTRELTNSIPSFNGFDIEGLGLLAEDGDVIVQHNDIPHIVTEFGAFPLSDVSLMTDAEREQFLPITKNFINILEKDTVTQNEIDLLVEQSEELSELIPEKFRDVITQSINDQFNS